MTGTVALTLRETAFVFGEKLRYIVRTIDEHAELGPRQTRENRKLRLLGMPDLIYLQALNEVGELLSPKGRFELHQALLEGWTREAVRVGNFMLVIGHLQSKVERRLDALAILKSEVEGDPIDPVIRGTRVEVYRVSALVKGGASVETVLHDYPALTSAQVELARVYAEVIPKKGRSYPRISFKRALHSLGLSALDELLDDGSRQ
jgi:hypothetical protein